MKRVHRKTHRTPEEKEHLQAVRDTFQAERPSLDDLIESGDYTEPVKHGVTLDVLRVAALIETRTGGGPFKSRRRFRSVWPRPLRD